MTGPVMYRVWEELTGGLHPAHWWLLRHHLLWPGRWAWERKVVRGIEAQAAEHGVQLIGTPIISAEQVGGRVRLYADAIAVGPPGLAAFELAPRDIVDREEGER